MVVFLRVSVAFSAGVLRSIRQPARLRPDSPKRVSAVLLGGELEALGRCRIFRSERYGMWQNVAIAEGFVKD